MSLKLNQHILATSFPVNASATILEGQVVTLNSSGEVILATHGVDTWILGLAGDVKGTLAAGVFTNRAWEHGDDTYASSKATVYRGVGTEVYVDTTDVILTGATVTIGTTLYLTATAGKMGNDPTTPSIQVARVIDNLSANGGYLDSGIPNVNVPTTDSDTPRTFLLISLLV